MRVLILDDEVMSVEIMLVQVNWEKCGVDEVLTAYSAEEAKETVQKHPIDIIFCDIEMPGESGLDFMHWARENGYMMTCIFLTCHAKFEYAQDAVRLGSMDYILLPAAFEQIEQKVKEAVEQLKNRQRDKQVMEMGEQYLQTKKSHIQEQYGVVKSRKQTAEEAENYIHMHLGDTELSVAGVAEAMNLSADYLNNIFKQEKKITLNKYIVQKRMELAGLLLREGNISISAVAEEAGYENYSYFSISFKKTYGCSPAAYVKRLSGENRK